MTMECEKQFQCPTCEYRFWNDDENLRAEFFWSESENLWKIEVTLHCPHCGYTAYTFIPYNEFFLVSFEGELE